MRRICKKSCVLTLRVCVIHLDAGRQTDPNALSSSSSCSPDRTAASEDEDDKPLVQPASREEPVRSESAAERSSAGHLTRRAPTSPSPMFTSTTSALSGDLFASRLLLIRNLHMKVGAVVPTGDFNKGAGRELASKRPHRPASDLSTRSRLQPRQCSEAYFWCYAIVGPWRRAHGCMRPNCCGFVKLSSPRTSGSLCAIGPSTSSLRRLG